MMARFPGADAVYAVADQFRERCLLSDRSLLWPDANAWTVANIDALLAAIAVLPTDPNAKTFLDRLLLQLVGKPDDVVRIAADAVTFYFLFPVPQIAGAKKYSRVDAIASLLKDSAGIPPAAQSQLSDVFSRGVGSPGTFFFTTQQHYLAHLLNFAILVKRQAPAPTTAESAGRLSKTDLGGAPYQHVMLHLLWPDAFERIATTERKKRIVAAFPDETGGEHDLDLALGRIRTALTDPATSARFDFYEPEYRLLWDPTFDPSESDPPSDAEADERIAAVRAQVESLYPDPDVRHACLREFAHSIRTAHALAPGSWSVTIRKAEPTPKLNVGRIQVARLIPNALELWVDRDAASTDTWTALSEDATLKKLWNGGGPRSLSRARGFGIPADRLDAILPVVRPLHDALLPLCIQLAQTSPWGRIHVDAVVAYLRQELDEDIPDPAYTADRPSTPAPGVTTNRAGAPARRYWKISAGEGGRMWSKFEAEQLMAIGWAETPDLSTLDDRSMTSFRAGLEAVLATQDQAYQMAHATSQLWAFRHEMQPGDLICAYGNGTILGTGTITGAYAFDHDADEYNHRRPVIWTTTISRPAATLSADLATKLRQNTTIIELTAADFAEIDPQVTSGEADTGRPTTWWVNQGGTYAHAREGGYLWASLTGKDDKTTYTHWSNVALLQPGDIVFHYAATMVRSVSVVESTAVQTTNPNPTNEATAGKPGHLVRTSYVDLSPPISLYDIPLEWRPAAAGPFTTDGGVKQGYLFALAPDTARFLVSHFDRDWPAFVRSLSEPLPPVFDQPPYVPPTLAEIETRIANVGLKIDQRTLRRYHLALRTRGFVILSGLSGTGKTWLATSYATAAGGQHLVVPVAPNWNANEDLLGYHNPLTGIYHHTAFTRFLAAASAAWHAAPDPATAVPHHVILDEMNLARVEYYFAAFLSQMELRARHGTATLQLSPTETVELTPNLCVIGTVNIDETTHGFADKVYDRAQLLEIEADRAALAAHLGARSYAADLLAIWDIVHRLAPFSFRVLDEIDTYVTAAATLGVPWEHALDEQLVQKILPKLKGSDHTVGAALTALLAATAGRFPLTHARTQVIATGYQLTGMAAYFG